MSMALSLRIITSFLLITATASSSQGGFTIALVHRHSNSSSSLLSNTGHLGLGSSPYADTVFDITVYLMKLQIGTPPVEIEAVLDTGSDLIWTQCLPCFNCYNQRDPIFNPSKSSTFKEKRCKTHDHSCTYEVVYGDQSYSKGTYVTETVRIQSTSGKSFVMPETTIGCSHNSSGFSTSTGSGIVGLSWGSLSLISQMGENVLGQFSYCLSGKGSSKINFGSNAIVAGEGTFATTMFMKKEKPGFYYLNLDAVSVGETRIETLGTPFHALDGNILIDSGTTFTYLPRSYCNQVKQAVENVVTAHRVAYSGDMLCYKSNTIEIFPVITMHFSGGADLVLDKYNMYVGNEGVYCLAIKSADPKPDAEAAVFGNRAQNNFLVGYDSSSLLVSFKPTDCSALWSYRKKPRESPSTLLLVVTILPLVCFFIFVLSLRLKSIRHGFVLLSNMGMSCITYI